MYNLCMYYEKQKSYDKTELTFQPTLVQSSLSRENHLYLRQKQKKSYILTEREKRERGRERQRENEKERKREII